MKITYKGKTYQLNDLHSDIVLERMREWGYELQPQEEKTEEKESSLYSLTSEFPSF